MAQQSASTAKTQAYTQPSVSHVFAIAATALGVLLLPRRYVLSGAPALTVSILLASLNGYRILPFANLWILLGAINTIYAVAATSWLLYWGFVLVCYPTIIISAIYQFSAIADLARKYLRVMLQTFDFTEDKIALFDLPALEIDTPDVKGGLMVIRGVTISLSSLTVIAHGIEVGIKLSDDMELALACDEVEIRFFRSIRVSDCYGNLKGGAYEMTFGHLAQDTRDHKGNHMMFESNTPILQAATAAVEAGIHRSDSTDSASGGLSSFSRAPMFPPGPPALPPRNNVASEDGTPSSISRVSTMQDSNTTSSMSELSTMTSAQTTQSFPQSQDHLLNGEPVTMVERMTGGSNVEDLSSAQEAANTMKKLSPDNEAAAKKYREMLQNIKETSIITQAKQELETRHFGERYVGPTRIIGDTLDPHDSNALRSATCSWLHDQPSVPHPSKRSIKVTTLQNLSSPETKKFMHRLPLLLRLLLSPIAYFHPITIDSITAGASGKWIEQMLQDNVLKGHTDQDSQLRNLLGRVSEWLTDANFVMELGKITAQGAVPISTGYEIHTHLSSDDVMAYRTASKDTHLKQVVRLGGADCRINIPAFLLPHHEHLLPPKATPQEQRDQEAEVRDADGHPKAVQAEADLAKLINDECVGRIAVHVRMPAVIDQDLLNFVAALVKATKLIELNKAGNQGPTTYGSYGATAPDPETSSIDGEENISPTLTHANTMNSMSTTASHINSKFKNIYSNHMRDVKGFTKDLTKSLASDIQRGIKRTTVDAVVNDRWIAKLVGKIAKNLEQMRGDVGYSGELPIALGPYRDRAEPEKKILP